LIDTHQSRHGQHEEEVARGYGKESGEIILHPTRERGPSHQSGSYLEFGKDEIAYAAPSRDGLIGISVTNYECLLLKFHVMGSMFPSY
jgi:hypothetical protein